MRRAIRAVPALAFALALWAATAGRMAGWALIAFGLLYLVWGIRRAVRNQPHTHLHFHADGSPHDHTHKHGGDHAHVHDEEQKVNITPWILFTIFVFGPCEPLIPLVMYPAAQNNTAGAVAVSIVFSIITIATMMAIVLVFNLGLSRINLKPVERYSNVIAGAIILVSGLAIQFLGL